MLEKQPLYTKYNNNSRNNLLLIRFINALFNNSSHIKPLESEFTERCYLRSELVDDLTETVRAQITEVQLPQSV